MEENKGNEGKNKGPLRVMVCWRDLLLMEETGECSRHLSLASIAQLACDEMLVSASKSPAYTHWISTHASEREKTAVKPNSA